MEKGFFKNIKFQNFAPKVEEDLEEHFDSGFGFKFTNNMRLVNDDGSFNIIKRGHGRLNGYERLAAMPWYKFFIILMLFYILGNSIFALLYMWVGIDQLSGVNFGDFWYEFYQCFFFSVQTFTTLGYGNIGPVGFEANVVAAVNAFVGLLAFALATGMFFARFSKARSYIKFSNNIILTPFAKKFKSIQIRIINSSRSKMTDMQARLLFTWLEKDGDKLRRKFHRLDLFIDSIYLFPLNWTIVHVIDEDSPFHGKTMDWINERNGELIVIVKGFDDTYSQFVTDYRGYDLRQLKEGVKFAGMYDVKDEETIVDIHKLDNLENISADY
jgi:inward rectifier potassium channel